MRNLAGSWSSRVAAFLTIALLSMGCTQTVLMSELATGPRETTARIELTEQANGLAKVRVEVLNEPNTVYLDRSGEAFQINDRPMRTSNFLADDLVATVPVVDAYRIEYRQPDDVVSAIEVSADRIPRFELGDVMFLDDPKGRRLVGTYSPASGRGDMVIIARLEQKRGEDGIVWADSGYLDDQGRFEIDLEGARSSRSGAGGSGSGAEPATAPRFLPGSATLSVVRSRSVPSVRLEPFAEARAVSRVVRTHELEVP